MKRTTEDVIAALLAGHFVVWIIPFIIVVILMVATWSLPFTTIDPEAYPSLRILELFSLMISAYFYSTLQ